MVSTELEPGGPWTEAGVHPVKIALPNGMVGYTLRAYRPVGEITPTDAPVPAEDEDDLFAARERARAAEEAGLTDTMVDDRDTVEYDHAEPHPSEFEEAEEEPQDEESAPPADEEVPLFLSHRGRLLLFGSPESLLEFVRSDAPHDLAQLESWPTVRKLAQPSQMVPDDEDTYELDLVVENLRGGHDAWDLRLLISAGEIARDLGYALKLRPVISAMSPGSPLDDLDEALRATAAGGISGLFARRRLRRIGAQQASLGWRSVIGKISEAMDWRE